jgi:hypothetical protein
MARTTGSPTSRRSGRGSGRGAAAAADTEDRDVDARGADDADDAADEQDDDGDEQELNTGELIAAALLGAAVGAGLGLLASRYVDSDDLRDRVMAVGRQVRSGVRRGVKQVRRRTPELPDVRGYAEKAREAFESALEREVRALKRGARRRRRRFGF